MPSPSILIVLSTVVINMTGVGLIWPIVPDLVEELGGGTISATAAIVGALSVGFALTQFLVAPFMGALSDQFGRRPVMLAALAGLGVDTILMAFAPSIAWLFAARMLGGALASTFFIANAFIADVSDGRDRAAGFGMVGAAFGLGFIIGPLLGGVLGEIDLRLPFYVAGTMALANCVFGYFFLKETLPAEKRVRRGFLEINPFGSIRWLARQGSILPITVALFLANAVQRGLEAIWVLFTKYQYGWGAREAGISLAIVGISYVIVQGYMVRTFVSRYGERAVIIGGFGLSAVMYLLLAFNTNGLIGFIGIVPYVVGWGLALPALQALASRAVDEKSQGYLQGGLSSVAGLAAIMGPALASVAFAWFTSEAAPIRFAGAYFLAGSVILGVLAIVGYRISRAR